MTSLVGDQAGDQTDEQVHEQSHEQVHDQDAVVIPQALTTRAVARPGILHYALLGVIGITAATLRLGLLTASSLWSDESNTWALIQRPWATIAQHAAADIHPPGYYWLLKGWTSFFGVDAAGMRSFSALAGVLLVVMVYIIGRQVAQTAQLHADFALPAAWLAAVNPFQVYYSQEARMYMLLALVGAGLFSALLAWFERERTGQSVRRPLALFIVCGALGLWIHYSFPILLAAAGLAYLWHWRERLRRGSASAAWALGRYALANLAILLLFAPWLGTAVERVLNWPHGGQVTSATMGLQLTLRTLAYGPLREVPQPLWPWLAAVGLLPLLGLAALIRRPVGVTLGLWLLAPVGMMAALGLFNDAFLKFLLVASPACVLLTAAAAWLLPYPRIGSLLLAAGGMALALLVLPGYYSLPNVRDNYAGVADYIRVMGDPETDLVLLNAPGQAEVWRYYDPGLPTLGLPAQRPPDPAATTAALAQAVADRRQVFALYWATDEADPGGIVERWLDQHAFRGLAGWQGNMRFVVYALPNQLTYRNLEPVPTFGSAIGLLDECQPERHQVVAAGQTALVELRWQTVAPLNEKYVVTLQLLDERNQVIAQHDAEPAGGSEPTDQWSPGVAVQDNHGLPIPPGTPPGVYRLIVAVYNSADGTRLPTASGDALELGTIEVERPADPLPADVLPIQVHANARLGPVMLAGYAGHRKAFSHAPETPLSPGDIAHFTFLWQAPDPLPDDWPDDAQFTLQLGSQTLTAPLAGGNYPTHAWQAGELVRGEFDLLYDGSAQAPVLTVEETSLELMRLPR